MRILINAVVVSLAVSVLASAQSAPDARTEALLKQLLPHSTRISAKEGALPVVEHHEPYGTSSVDPAFAAQSPARTFAIRSRSAKTRPNLTCVDYKPQRDASDQEQRSADGDPISHAATATLVEAGANVNARTPAGFTALHFAMRAGNIAVVNALCEHGAYVNDPIQPTAVARPGAPAMRTYGAPQAAHMVDAVDVNGDTALHGAAHRGANVIVAFLVEKGARLDVVDVICWTDPSTKKFISLRVPYPLSFFTRSGTGRIDNPNTGWKGKGFWASYATYASWHIEGGKGSLPKAVKFQMRPSPLAK